MASEPLRSSSYFNSEFIKELALWRLECLGVVCQYQELHAKTMLLHGRKWKYCNRQYGHVLIQNHNETMSCRLLIKMTWNSGVICTGIRIPLLKTHFHHISLSLGSKIQFLEPNASLKNALSSLRLPGERKTWTGKFSVSVSCQSRDGRRLDLLHRRSTAGFASKNGIEGRRWESSDNSQSGLPAW